MSNLIKPKIINKTMNKKSHTSNNRQTYKSKISKRRYVTRTSKLEML